MLGLKTIQDLRHLGFLKNIPKIYMDPSCIYIWNRNSSSDDKRENCFDLGHCNVRAKRNQLDARENLREQLKVGNRRIWFPQAVL